MGGRSPPIPASSDGTSGATGPTMRPHPPPVRRASRSGQANGYPQCTGLTAPLRSPVHPPTAGNRTTRQMPCRVGQWYSRRWPLDSHLPVGIVVIARRPLDRGGHLRRGRDLDGRRRLRETAPAHEKGYGSVMSMNGPMRFRRCLSLAAILALFAAFSLPTVTRAATSGNVAVTASLASTLTMTLCDQTADFGSGLNASGDPVSGTSDLITPVKKTAGSPDGAFYRWDPNCPSGQNFLTVNSNVPWQSTICATAGNNTSTLTLSDLRYTTSTMTLSYSQVASSALVFPSCSSPQTLTSGSPGTSVRDAVYYLQIDPSDGAGSFAATTTLAVTAS